MTNINPNKALWEKGDFTRIAATMRESGEAAGRLARHQPGMDVLDLGCGDGTTALPAARLGANVLGVDIAANLVAAGNARARGTPACQSPLPAGRCLDARPVCATNASIWSSASSARCSRRARSMSRRKWCASPAPAAAS